MKGEKSIINPRENDNINFDNPDMVLIIAEEYTFIF